MKKTKTLTLEQEILLLWLDIKLYNNEIAESTYAVMKSCIINNKPHLYKKPTVIEMEYLSVFALEKDTQAFINECFRIKEKMKNYYK